MSDPIGEYRDAAQAMVTALLHDDPDTAATIGESVPDPTTLAFTLASLASTVHVRWSVTNGLDRGAGSRAWSQILLDITEERLTP